MSSATANTANSTHDAVPDALSSGDKTSYKLRTTVLASPVFYVVRFELVESNSTRIILVYCAEKFVNVLDILLADYAESYQRIGAELPELDFAAPVGVYAIEDVAADVVQSQGFRVLEQYLGWRAR